MIPWNGGASKDGWYYEPLRHVLGAYAAVHGCAAAPEPTDPMSAACAEGEGVSDADS